MTKVTSFIYPPATAHTYSLTPVTPPVLSMSRLHTQVVAWKDDDAIKHIETQFQGMSTNCVLNLWKNWPGTKYKASNWENLPKGDLSYTLESRQTPALYSGSRRWNLRMVSQGANKRYLPFSEEYFSLPSAIYWRRLQHSHIYLSLVVEKGKIGVKIASIQD